MWSRSTLSSLCATSPLRFSVKSSSALACAVNLSESISNWLNWTGSTALMLRYTCRCLPGWRWKEVFTHPYEYRLYETSVTNLYIVKKSYREQHQAGYLHKSVHPQTGESLKWGRYWLERRWYDHQAQQLLRSPQIRSLSIIIEIIFRGLG